MYILKSNSTDAYFNIALEEYFIQNFNDDFFIVSVNEPSIVVGFNQNTYDEINALYVKQNSIKVVRRLSGGSTIFQDEANLNFSNIFVDKKSALLDFSSLNELIKEFLEKKLRLSIELSDKRQLRIDNKKFSSIARYRLEDKILNHGTLLLLPNKQFLTNAFKIGDEETDRALRSNHEKVTYLAKHLSESLSIEKFKDLFVNYVQTSFPNAKLYELSSEDIENVNKLVMEKYSTWDWNYGSKLEYNFSNSYKSKAGKVDIYLNLEDNIINQARIHGDFFSQKSLVDIENALIGVEYKKESIQNVLKDFDLSMYFVGISDCEIISCFGL